MCIRDRDGAVLIALHHAAAARHEQRLLAGQLAQHVRLDGAEAVLARLREDLLHALALAALEVRAVSYTHLDVYKRQV